MKNPTSFSRLLRFADLSPKAPALACAEIKITPYTFLSATPPQRGSLLNDRFWLNLSRPETPDAGTVFFCKPGPISGDQENQFRILELQAYIQLDVAIRQTKITGTWLSWIMGVITMSSSTTHRKPPTFCTATRLHRCATICQLCKMIIPIHMGKIQRPPQETLDRMVHFV